MNWLVYNMSRYPEQLQISQCNAEKRHHESLVSNFCILMTNILFWSQPRDADKSAHDPRSYSRISAISTSLPSFDIISPAFLPSYLDGPHTTGRYHTR